MKCENIGVPEAITWKKWMNQSSFLRSKILTFWFFSIATVLVAVIIAVTLYVSKFNGGLANASAEWSNFGSYIGGVFGPLVSFLTLCAVLKTVYMQREMLDSQNREFAEINKHQALVLESQYEQLAISKKESERSRIQAYQTAQVQLLASIVEQKRRLASDVEATKSSMSILEVNTSRTTGHWNRLDDVRREALEAVDKLSDLSIEISINEYASFDDVHWKMVAGLQAVGYPMKPVGDVAFDQTPKSE